MPLLILAVLAGIAAFYFKGRPTPYEWIAPELPPRAEVTGAPEALPPPSPATVASDARTPAPTPPGVSATTPPIVARAGLRESDFTPWMSSLALDTYLRQKNRGERGSYWARGHWIRAIEGRWHEGAREYRIALGVMVRPGEIQWHYRIDLTEIAFAEELARMSAREFQLAQSQACRHPDGSMRYQAVWQREGDAPVAKR